MKYVTETLKSTPTLIILSLGFIYLEFFAPLFYSTYIGTFDAKQTAVMLFYLAYTGVALYAAPILSNKFIFKIELKDLGLALPENKKLALFLSVCALIILLPFVFSFAKKQQFQSYYSFGHISLLKFFIIHFTIMPLYYFFEEFFFRGFLLINLWKKVRWHSYWITDILFAYAHIGKPGLEILLAVPESIILSFIVITTRSIYPTIAVHWTIGIVLNFLVNF